MIIDLTKWPAGHLKSENIFGKVKPVSKRKGDVVQGEK
jgi:hypothetical protein